MAAAESAVRSQSEGLSYLEPQFSLVPTSPFIGFRQDYTLSACSQCFLISQLASKPDETRELIL